LSVGRRATVVHCLVVKLVVETHLGNMDEFWFNPLTGFGGIIGME
jgi:hypothetical protein